MRAGQLRHVVQLEDRTIAAGALGEPTETWTVRHPLRCEIKQLNGGEPVVNVKQEPRASYTVRTRYCEIARERCRLRWGDVILNIVTIDNVNGRNVELIMQCVEVR